jgi:hypothetical protein
LPPWFRWLQFMGADSCEKLLRVTAGSTLLIPSTIRSTATLRIGKLAGLLGGSIAGQPQQYSTGARTQTTTVFRFCIFTATPIARFQSHMSNLTWSSLADSTRSRYPIPWKRQSPSRLSSRLHEACDQTSPQSSAVRSGFTKGLSAHGHVGIVQRKVRPIAHNSTSLGNQPAKRNSNPPPINALLSEKPIHGWQ